MSTLLYDSLFVGPTSANATPGSLATGTTGAHDAPSPGTTNQLVDVLGGSWMVDSSGNLTGLPESSGAAGALLVWPAPYAATASRIVAWVAPGQPAAVTCQVGLRYATGSGSPEYYAGEFTPATSAITIKTMNGSTPADPGSGALAGTISPAYNSAHTYRLDLTSSAVVSGYITTLTFKVYDDTAGTLVGTLSGDDYSGALASPGVPLIAAVSTDPAAHPTYTRAQVWDPTTAAPLVAPTLVLSSATATAVTTGFSGTSGGTPPYSTAVYWSPASGFTPPDAGTLVGSPVTGASGAATHATPPAAVNFYRSVTTDSDGAPQTALSVELAASPQLAPLVIGFVGDSITFGTGATPGTNDTPTLVGATLAAAHGDRTVTVVNQGQPGAVTGYWLPGVSPNYYDTAVAAFAAAGVTVVHVMLGTNDSSNAYGHIDANTYGSNLSVLVSALVAAGYKVVLSYPIFMATGDSLQYALMPQYRTRIDALVDNVHVFAGDTLAFRLFANRQSLLTDGIHPGPAGTPVLASAWTPPIAGALKLSGGGRLAAALSHPYIGVSL